MTTMSDLLATAEQLTVELEWYASRKKDLSDNAPGSGGQSWADLMLSEINAMRETLGQIAAEHQKNSQGKC